MDDKYTLSAIAVVCLLIYGCFALYCGHNGNITTLIISAIVGIIAGTIGFTLAKIT